MQERTSSNLVTGQTSRQKIQELLLHTDDKVGLLSKTGESQKKFLENWRIFLIFPKFSLWGLHSLCFFLVSEWQIFCKKKTHCYERVVSTWNTSVKSYRQTLLSYYLDFECAPRFLFSREYFWELNGLSFMGIRSRKNGISPRKIQPNLVMDQL